MSRPVARRRRAERGQSLAEFALVLPGLLLIFLAIFDVGRGVYAYSTIDNAARTAARVAIVNQTTATIRDTAVAQAVSLSLPPSAVAVEFRTPDNTAVCASRSIGCLAVVTISYDFVPIIGELPGIATLIGPMTMSSSSNMPIERTYP